MVAPSTEENGDAVGNSASTSAEPRGAKFKPTQAWLDAWKSRLPIDTIMRLLDHLKPQIEDMCRAHVESCLEASSSYHEDAELHRRVAQWQFGA